MPDSVSVAELACAAEWARSLLKRLRPDVESQASVLPEVSVAELADHIVEVLEHYAGAVGSSAQVQPMERLDRFDAATAALLDCWPDRPAVLSAAGSEITEWRAGWIIVGELLVHSHDLGSVVVADPAPEEVQSLACRTRVAAGSFLDAYRTLGTVGSEVEAEAEADDVTRLARFYGRGRG